MKLNRLEAHDRLLHFRQDQRNTIQQGADDCLKKNPLSLKLQEKSPYIYIWAHPRTADDGVTKRMLWQARLTRPTAQTNSYLFRAQSHTDLMEICWMLPPREMWKQYEKGQVCENEYVLWSIAMFEGRRNELETSDPEDLSDEQARHIYHAVRTEMSEEKRIKSLYGVK